MKKNSAKIYIVGAGPGSSELITLWGVQILGSADCVIYDKSINKRLLKFASPKARKFLASQENIRQHNINELLLEKSKKYKVIVRLKNGEPMIFGRSNDEIKSLVQNNIEFEIIPGITAASAAAACTKTVLADIGIASSVTFVAGQDLNGQTINIDFKSLVKLKGNLVFYMAVSRMSQICKRLIDAGMAKTSKAVVAANTSLPNQKIVTGKLSNIANKCRKAMITPPAVLIITQTDSRAV